MKWSYTLKPLINHKNILQLISESRKVAVEKYIQKSDTVLYTNKGQGGEGKKKVLLEIPSK